MYKAISVNDIPNASEYKLAWYEKDLNDFLETGYVACEIQIPKGRTPKLVYGGFQRAVRRTKAPVHVMKRGDRIFLLKKSAAPGAQNRKAARK